MDKENVDSKTYFLFTLSHEIKNALNIINIMCCMVENNIDDRERALKYLNRIYSITEHISDIMNKSLDVATYNNRLTIDQEPFKLNNLKEELYQLLLPLAENKNIDFRVVYENDDEKEVVGDYGRLLQILINLVSNSIKYTPDGGRIVVWLKAEQHCAAGTTIKFICLDNGIGMQEEFLEHIYVPFARAEDDRASKAKGTGLGMAVVKELVDAMGGSIHIASTINVGTTVTVQLKLKNYIRKG